MGTDTADSEQVSGEIGEVEAGAGGTEGPDTEGLRWGGKMVPGGVVRKQVPPPGRLSETALPTQGRDLGITANPRKSQVWRDYRCALPCLV